MSGGAFTPGVRAAILQVHPGCVGCGQPVTDVHHRAPRRAGGTRRVEVGAPYNGLGLCSPHHAWAERHRATAGLLGWLLHEPDPHAPFWTTSFGWLRWALLDDHPPPCWCITQTDPPGPDAHAAARAFARQETT